MRISVTSKAFSKNEYLIRLVPVENGKYAHHALVIFGRNMIEDFHPDGGGWKIPTNILYKNLDNIIHQEDVYINVLKNKQALWEQIVRIIQSAELRNP